MLFTLEAHCRGPSNKNTEHVFMEKLKKKNKKKTTHYYLDKNGPYRELCLCEGCYIGLGIKEFRVREGD